MPAAASAGPRPRTEAGKADRGEGPDRNALGNEKPVEVEPVGPNGYSAGEEQDPQGSQTRPPHSRQGGEQGCHRDEEHARRSAEPYRPIHPTAAPGKVELPVTAQERDECLAVLGTDAEPARQGQHEPPCEGHRGNGGEPRGPSREGRERLRAPGANPIDHEVQEQAEPE